MTTIPIAASKSVAMLILFLAGMFFIIRGLIWGGLGWEHQEIFLIAMGIAFIVGGIVVWRIW